MKRSLEQEVEQGKQRLEKQNNEMLMLMRRELDDKRDQKRKELEAQVMSIF